MAASKGKNRKSGLQLLFILMVSIVLILVAGRFRPEAGPGRRGEVKDFTDYLNARIPELMKEYDIPGVNIALVRGGMMVWSSAYGYADIGEGRPMTVETRCRVESISKSVTAWGVLKLAEEGKIDLDKPLASYLKSWSFPSSDYPAEEITIRQLLTQTSGMPLGTIGVLYAPWTDKPALREQLTADAVMRQEPGRSFFYSNTGYILLELLIEEVSGRSFADYMEREVLMPLGMFSSSFEWSSSWNPPVPNGYDGDGNPIPPYVYPDKAAGGLFATVGDVAAFVSAGMSVYTPRGGQVLSPESIEAMYAAQTELDGYYSLVFDAYGFGHFIEFLPDGRKAVSHGGQGSGWMTHFHSIPESGDGIVILTNSQNSWPLFARLLTDWGGWLGVSSIGMGLIVRAGNIIRAALALVLALNLWQIYRLVKRQRSRVPVPLRALQVIISISLIAGLAGAMSMDYLFVTSVFPKISGLIGFVMLFSALVLLASALLPGSGASPGDKAGRKSGRLTE